MKTNNTKSYIQDQNRNQNRKISKKKVFLKQGRDDEFEKKHPNHKQLNDE